MKRSPNHALQRTRRERRGCNHCALVRRVAELGSLGSGSSGHLGILERASLRARLPTHSYHSAALVCWYIEQALGAGNRKFHRSGREVADKGSIGWSLER